MNTKETLNNLRSMLAYEKRQAPENRHGAHISHWAGQWDVQIDEAGIKALIRYYEGRNKK